MLRHPGTGELPTTARADTIARDMKCTGHYYYTMLAQLETTPNEIKQRQKSENIFLERYEREYRYRHINEKREIQKETASI